MTDRRTDGRTDTERQQRPRLHIASRGKNASLYYIKYPHEIYRPMSLTIDFNSPLIADRRYLRITPPHAPLSHAFADCDIEIIDFVEEDIVNN